MSSINNISDNIVKTLLHNITKTSILVSIICTIVLIFLWIANYLKIPLFSPQTINIQEKSITEGTTYILETNPLKLFDIQIKADVATLDNLIFTEQEKKLLKSYESRFPNSKNSIRLLLSGYNANIIWNRKSYPINADVFRRFNELMKESIIQRSLFIQQRKQVFLSEDYWKLTDSGARLLVFPPEIQYSVSVLTIQNVKGSAKLFLDVTSDPLKQALRKVSGQQTKIIECTEGIIYACIFSGETLKFESENYKWTIVIKKIVNPGTWRGEDDLVIIDWTAVKL